MNRFRTCLAALALLPCLAAAETNVPQEVWVALRADGQAGTGTVTDPFDAGSVDKFNGLFDKFANDYGEHLALQTREDLHVARMR